MIRPACSVVCRMRATALSYAGTKQCLGPVYDSVLARAHDVRQYGSCTHIRPVRETCCCMPYCTTESFALGLVSSSTLNGQVFDESQEMDEPEVGQLLTG